MSCSPASRRSASPSARLAVIAFSAASSSPASPQLTDLLAQLVDLTADVVALGGDLAQTLVEARRVIELVEHLRAAAPGQRGAHAVGSVRSSRTSITASRLARRPATGRPPIFRTYRGGVAAPVVVDDLVVRYGDLVAVDGVSFHADAGKVTAVLGPNGAGKTTTIEVCEGFRRPTRAGRVLGLDPTTPSAPAQQRMGVMLQDGGVYPSSASCATSSRCTAALYGKRRRAGRICSSAVGLGERVVGHVAAAVGRRAAAAVARARARRPSRRSPSSTSRRPASTSPAASSSASIVRELAGEGCASCSPPTSSTRPSGSPTAS